MIRIVAIAAIGAVVMLMSASVEGGAFPWYRLEADAAVRGGDTRTLAEGAYADEASRRRCVELLCQGAWVEWTIDRPAGGAVLRYSVPDTSDGAGMDLPLEVVVNGVPLTTVTLTSRLSHLYAEEYHESGDPRDGNHRRFYDEVRFRLAVSEGDRLRLRLPTPPPPGDQPVILDFAELEPVGEPVAPPPDAMDLVRDFGASGADEADDWESLVRALEICAERQRPLYIPPGVYRLSRRVDLPSGVTIQGAGMWWTELHFTASPGRRSGGLYTADNATDLVLREFYLRGRASVRGMGGQPMNGGWGRNSRLENVWWEHLNNARFTNSDELRIVGCRARNNLAGGIILFGGSVDAVIEDCHVRYANDDGIGSFASGAAQGRVRPNRDNVIRNNLIELTGRAGGIGIFGGRRIEVRDNFIVDTLPSAQADLRFTTSFDQYPFGSDEPVVATGNVMRGFRGQMGAILFATRYSPTSNILVRGNRIERLDGPALYFRCQMPHRTDRVKIEDLEVEFDPESTAPGIVCERRFEGKVELKNVDILGPARPIENASESLELDFDAECKGWGK